MNQRLIAAIFMTAFLQEVAIVLLRVTTSYRALELGLSPLTFGVINSCYAVLPLFLSAVCWAAPPRTTTTRRRVTRWFTGGRRCV